MGAHWAEHFEERSVGVGEMSPWHWAIVIAVAVLLFGAKRLPDAARSLGQSARILRGELHGKDPKDQGEAATPPAATPPAAAPPADTPPAATQPAAGTGAGSPPAEDRPAESAAAPGAPDRTTAPPAG